MYKKIIENHTAVSEEEARKTAGIVALSAIKYGDLSNQASKDYIFDIERFTSFEGNTGPYINRQIYPARAAASSSDRIFVSW